LAVSLQAAGGRKKAVTKARGSSWKNRSRRDPRREERIARRSASNWEDGKMLAREKRALGSRINQTVRRKGGKKSIGHHGIGSKTGTLIFRRLQLRKTLRREKEELSREGREDREEVGGSRGKRDQWAVGRVQCLEV